MCYPKPGPRCSAHAKEKLREASKAFKANDSFDNFMALKDAQQAYETTPEGIRELKKQLDSMQGVDMTLEARITIAEGTRQAQIDAYNKEVARQEREEELAVALRKEWNAERDKDAEVTATLRQSLTDSSSVSDEEVQESLAYLREKAAAAEPEQPEETSSKQDTEAEIAELRAKLTGQSASTETQSANPSAANSTPRMIPATECAKLVRKTLKEKFPNTKFSVRTHKYAGGASVDVHYHDRNLPEQEVTEVVSKFQGASFDGMTDSMSYHDSTLNGEKVWYGANFVFATNTDRSDD